jgi:hypothetical protein
MESCISGTMVPETHSLVLVPAGLASAARGHARHIMISYDPMRERLMVVLHDTRKGKQDGYIVWSHRLPSPRVRAEDDLSKCGVMTRWGRIWRR